MMSDSHFDNKVQNPVVNNGLHIFSEMELNFVSNKFVISTDSSSIEIDRWNGTVKGKLYP